MASRRARKKDAMFKNIFWSNILRWHDFIQRYRHFLLAGRELNIDRTSYIDQNVSVGSSPKTGVQISVIIGAKCEIGKGVQIHPWFGRVFIGRNVFIGPYVVIYGHGGVEIGDNSLISMHCCIVSSNHTVPSRARLIRDHPDIPLPTKIGCDVWLGAGVRVMGGVNIGDGCVVGAGAVVVRDLPAYSISVGVPAKVIGFRE